MKNIKKLLSFILALAVILTSFAGINMFSVSAASVDDIKTAAGAYVKANENAVTAEGLLAAVQAVDSSITLDTANDFYIKHAVPGVKDVMANGSTNEYPLNIEGSDGAVAAVFGFNGERVGFTCAFAHEVETIEINEVAIVGQSSGFSYGGSANSGKNVTAYTGTADKIVFPAGYKGTMAVAAVNNVKVVIYNNGVSFFGGAFKGSPSLKAVQIDNGDTALQLASTTNVWSTVTKATGMFSACPELKYFKLPNNITNNGDHYWTNLFPNDFLKDCPKLENVVMPTTSVGSRFTSYGYQVFYGTAIRDVVLPSNPAAITIKENAFGGSKIENGTRNIHQYADDMTNIRAVALAMAEVNELLRTDATGEQIVAGAKSAITGAHNAADVAEMINITTEGEVNNDLYVGTSIRIAAGSDTFIYEKGENKALASLNTNIALDQVFNPATANYTAIVVDDITAVEVNAVAVDGAVVGTITGNTTLTVGKNVITIPVTTTEGVSVNYTITVLKYGSLPEAVKKAAEAYVKANENAVTADGLLAAVQAVDSSITLDTANDFYIKHAVDGVKDVMANGNENKYPLVIEGSDGAVAAVFDLGGIRYGFTCAFAHEVETIEIDEVAVVGTSAGFTYDDSGNVTAYTGTADKIVLPEDYAGTFVEITDQTYVDNVKVLIYNNKQYIRAKAFYDWDGLIAVQFKAGNSAWLIGGNNSNRDETYGFAECDNLKYVKLPDIINTSWYGEVLHNYMFANSKKLENLSFPELYPEKDTKTCFRTYYGTAIRDFVLPQYYITGTGSGHTTFEGYSADSPSYDGGTRNVHYYSDAMTFVRAAALAAAAVNEASLDATEDDIKDIALNAITGSADSESFRNSLKYIVTSSLVNSDSAISTKFVLSNSNDIMPIALEMSKGLESLNTDCGINPAFDPATLNYTVSIAEFVDKVNVDAVAVQGASVGEISETDGVITIPVTTTEGKSVNYTITVVRNEGLDESVYTVADAYVQEKGNKVTLEGLLNAVNTVWADATIADADFYVKHAVHAVVDNDDISGYQLSIEGSKGSVTAIIEYQGVRYTFNTVFDYQTEVIDIDSYAIVGDEAYAEYFTYDEAGNVTALNKPVEKLIFPVGFAGTMTKLGEESLINADRVKVVIYNNGVAFLSSAFSGWQGLRAVKIDNGDTALQLASSVNNARENNMFSFCPNLKYFEFPNKICNNQYWNSMFPDNFFEGSNNLETVIMAKEAITGVYEKYGDLVFYGTKVQELVLPNYYRAVIAGKQTFDSSTVTEGTRNIHYHTEEMTYVRAVSLIAAGLNADSDDVIADAKALIVEVNNSADYAESLEYSWREIDADDYNSVVNLAVSNGTDFAYIDAKLSKTLAELTVEKYALDLEFDSSKLEYEIIAPYLETTLDINAIAVDGATVTSIDADIVDNCAEITVTNTDGNVVTYKINVKREGEVNAEVLSAIRGYLLDVKVCPELDMNMDTYFDVRDLVRAKKLAVKDYKNDSENIPVIAANLNSNNETQLASMLSYENSNGQITDTLFEGVAFRPSVEWMFVYPDGVQTQRNTTKRDWSSFLYNNILQDDYNLPALEEAAGNLRQTLCKPEYKASVYLPLMGTQIGFDGWGEIDGVALDFTNSSDQIAALKWLVDESIAAFNAKGYVNVELCGFYYINEGMRDGDIDILPVVTEYIRSKGLKTFWAPFSNANGTLPTDEYHWDDYGFDEATYQINYFPGNETLPAARDESYIEKIAERAATDGANIQMELCGQTKENISGIKKYFEGGITYGYMERDFISWWIMSDCETVEYLRDSEDEYIRSTYDEIYKFNKKTLKGQEINTVTGD